MVRLRIIVLALLVLSACSSPVPRDLEARFWSNRDLFDSLAMMIDADGTKHEYVTLGSFAVGTDRIGEYWRDGLTNAYWSLPAESRPVPRREALASSGISDSRFDQYMQDLSQIGAERIEYYQGHIRFLMHRQGIAVSGCGIWIHFRGEVTAKGADASKITTLDGLWQLEDECT